METPRREHASETPRATRATYDDLVNAPSDRLAEIINGELITSPRRSIPQANAASVLGAILGSAFRLGVGGPGGWHLLDQPELHFGSSEELDVLVPDLVGWRRERLPQLPDAPHMRLAPDWICEVLSDSTEAVDRIRKMPIYLREGVTHAWLVSPKHRTVEVYRRSDAGWVIVGQYEGAQAVRAEPFEAIELQLGHLWSAPVKQAAVDHER